MVGSKWVSGSGLVLDMNPTVVNVVVDVLFALLFAVAGSLLSNVLVAVRKKAIIRADPRNLPLGRFDLVEVIKEWFAIRSGNQNKSVYGTVVMVSVLLLLAQPVADSGLTFNKHPMGKTIRSTLHYLREARTEIVFQRNAEPGMWRKLRTETGIMEQSYVDDLNLYRKSLQAGNIFSDILGENPGINGTSKYSGVFRRFTDEDPVPITGSQQVHLSWREAYWLIDILPELEINVTKGAPNMKRVRFHTNEYKVSTNMPHERGYNASSDCLIETLRSGIENIPLVCMLCRQVWSTQVHRYLVMSTLCAEEIKNETVRFHRCIPPSGIVLASEIEEAVADGSLSPVPLAIFASYIGMIGNYRQLGQTYRAAILQALGAARFYSARQLEEREEVTRPEIKIRLLGILGVYIFFMFGILVWKFTYLSHIKMMDVYVAAAHVPSYAYEWALKARNEKLKEWPDAESKPDDVIVSPFLGIVHTDEHVDHLGITANPQPSRGQPFSRSSAYN